MIPIVPKSKSSKLFSIVIATFNSGCYLQGSIDSIKSQDFPNVELIVVDGGSIDNTLQIIHSNEMINYWISEPDFGIYDAWNKGLALATGDWIMFIGSDDILLPNALKEYSKFINGLNDEKIEFISSRLQLVDNNLNVLQTKGTQWEWPGFLYDMLIAHPGSLHSRKLFNRLGEFNTDYKIVGDYELLLRAGNTLATAYLNFITVKMRMGGASDSIKAIKEACKAVILTGKQNKAKAIFHSTMIATRFSIKKVFKSLGVDLNKKK